MDCGRIALVWKLKANAEPRSDDGSRSAETQILKTGVKKAGAAFKVLTVRDLKRQSMAWMTLSTREPCEMHEMVKRQSRFGATVNRPTSAEAKGKLR